MNKFESKVKILIHATILFVLSVSLLFTFFVIMRIYNEDYLIKTQEFMRQYNQRTDYFIEELEKNTQTLAMDNEIIKAVQNEIYNPMVRDRINEIAMMNENIIGITVYGKECVYASDAVIGSNPSEKFIVDTYNIDEFLSSDDSHMWLLRNRDSYGDYYRGSNNFYKTTRALYSCVHKIFSNTGAYVGFVMLDTNAEKLFSVYPDDNLFLGNTELYIKNADGITADKENERQELKENGRGMTEISYKLLNSENYIVIQVNKASVYKGMIPVMLIILLIAVIWYIICIPYSRFIVSSIIVPINNLREKISEYNSGGDNE